MKKKFSNIICVLLCFALCGCSGGEIVSSSSSSASKSTASKSTASKSTASKSTASKSTASKSTASQSIYNKSTLNLPYALNKSLNPFTANSLLNLMLWPLMYDCLCEPNENFMPVNVLASSIINKGNTVTCTLINAKFTDGSPVTSNDVKYSFNLALSNKAGYFYSQVLNIASINTPNAGTVVFTLKTPDPLFANILDIPIIKANSDKKPQTQLIGSGKYIYKKNGNNAILEQNKNWFGKKAPQIKTIQLIDMPDDTAIADSINIGSLDYVLSDYGTATPMNISLGAQSINLNQIVYIGINSNNTALSDPNVRKAISLIIDRTELVKDVYSSHALAAALPFDPEWANAPKSTDSELISSVNEANSDLALAGYTQKNTNGVFTKTEGGVTTTLNFTLTVNSNDNLHVNAAEKIAGFLKNDGINVTVNQIDFATYTSDIQTTNFDMYIGDLKLADDMDLSPFFTAGSTVASGMVQPSNFYTAFLGYENNNTSLNNAATAFRDEMPFIPLCYRIGSVSYPRIFFNNIITTNHDIFYNIEDWK
jgi:peptide/nickel transport system substrate-binding protein